MRTVARFAMVGALILSCFDITAPGRPPRCSTPADTLGFLTGGPLRLAVGGADNRTAAWMLRDCNGMQSVHAPSSVTWLVRDGAVARLETPREFADPAYTRTVVAGRPGRTFVVMQVPGRVDSVSVQVIDTASMDNVTRVSAASARSCAVNAANILYCWGAPMMWNPEGATSCFGPACHPVPVQVDSNIRSVHIGAHKWCRIRTNGAVACADTTGIPREVAFSSFTFGMSHSCGLDAEGRAFCWGRPFPNLYSNAPGAPEVTGGHRWTGIAAHGDRTCGVTVGGELYCWGVLAGQGVSVPGATTCTVSYSDKNGGTVTERYPCSSGPLRVGLTRQGTDTTFAEISERCARTVSGSVFCHDPGTGRFVEKVGFGPFRAIAVGFWHGCGLDTAGRAWCWGENHQGQLGDGTTITRATPVVVAGTHTFTQLAVGDGHTCGLKADGDVWCWGGNRMGESGVPILTTPLAPVRVRGQP